MARGRIANGDFIERGTVGNPRYSGFVTHEQARMPPAEEPILLVRITTIRKYASFRATRRL